MTVLTHLNNRIPYDLKRTGRRSVAIKVEPDGAITVIAPISTLANRIDQWVQKRAGWIQKKLSYFETYRKEHRHKEFVSGESFPVWGRKYRLKVVRDSAIRDPHCELADGRLQVSIPSEDLSNANGRVRDLLQDWYARQTEKKLQETVPKLAVRLGVCPGAVKVVRQKKRWASCSRKGSLRFNWRLSMMPPSILGYVIVHELAHLKAPNHSKRFWTIVQSILPDFEKRRLWLRENEGADLFEV